MNDDREVTCYALLVPTRVGRTCWPPRARPGWPSASRTTAASCWPSTLVDAKLLGPDDAGKLRRLPPKHNRAKGWRVPTAALLGDPAVKAVTSDLDSPVRYLALKANAFASPAAPKWPPWR
jgi:soluble lytic murein transglycosylase